MELYNNWTGIVDAFAGYDNLLTFTVGSAVLSEPRTPRNKVPCDSYQLTG